MNLNELRAEIDRTDDELMRLFTNRMELCVQVAEFKKANELPIFQSGREEELLERIKNKSPDWLELESLELYKVILKLSKRLQSRVTAQGEAEATAEPPSNQSRGSVSVIIAAGGNATRMNGVNKQFAILDGIPVIVRSMLAFEKIEEVAEILVSARSEDIERVKKEAERYNITKLAAVVEGGETRQKSIFKAFAEVSKETGYIAVHDGARPLADRDRIKRCIKDAATFGGAVLGVPVKDTLKTVDGGIIKDTPDRRKLYSIQTPQVFRRDIYVKGINFANEHNLDFTDDCQLAEAVGVKVFVTESDYRNIKITTPEDLAIAEAILCSE
ncbi:MAG: 2-C-methyl-D-erythritol 4-phosphate cytidylyltransferase [Oscillospiraceae bacterium]|nr:2-C-methyl-D-erythritol 4-phosphate cytidylyltransferase [Oscillospiraceae bacterium]